MQYSERQGEKHFYELLKPLASLETLLAEDYIDWGQEEKFATAIGVGECAGVMIDLVATLILEADENSNGRRNAWKTNHGRMVFIMLIQLLYILPRPCYYNKECSAIHRQEY